MSCLIGKLVLVGLHIFGNTEDLSVNTVPTSNGKIQEDDISDERLCNLYFQTFSDHKFIYFSDNSIQFIWWLLEMPFSYMLWLKTFDFLYHVGSNLINIWRHVWCSPPQTFPSLNKCSDFFCILIRLWVPLPF